MKSEPDPHAEYQLVVRGELDDRYGCLFEGMQMARAGGATVLVGRIRDQAQRYGFIERIANLGLQPLSLTYARHATPEAC